MRSTLALLFCVSAIAQQSAPPEARDYDRLVGRWNAQLAPELVRFAGLTDGASVLDYSSATGYLARVASARLRTSQIIGVDTSQPFVSYAQTQVANARVRFQVVPDLLKLPFPNGQFDAAFSLGVMAMPEYVRAIREMQRVTKPEGVVVSAVWDYGPSLQPLALFWQAAGRTPPAEEPMPRLETVWKDAGFRDVVEQTVDVDLSFSNFADYWALFTIPHGFPGEYLAAQSEPARAALRDRLQAMVLKGRRDGPFTLRARASMVKGVVRYQ